VVIGNQKDGNTQGKYFSVILKLVLVVSLSFSSFLFLTTFRLFLLFVKLKSPPWTQGKCDRNLFNYVNRETDDLDGFKGVTFWYLGIQV
jgi:hypothetical protein